MKGACSMDLTEWTRKGNLRRYFWYFIGSEAAKPVSLLREIPELKTYTNPTRGIWSYVLNDKFAASLPYDFIHLKMRANSSALNEPMLQVQLQLVD